MLVIFIDNNGEDDVDETNEDHNQLFQVGENGDSTPIVKVKRKKHPNCFLFCVFFCGVSSIGLNLTLSRGA